MSGCRRDEPAQWTQLPDGVCRSGGQASSLRHARQGCLGLGSICWGIAATQRASEGHPIRGHRYERGLHQGSKRQPRERAGGVRQVPRHPVWGGGRRPDSEDLEPGRCQKARPVGANPVDVAEEPGELDGKGGPEVGVDVPGTVCDGNGLRDEAGASRHL
jgi:hypothetical protein